MEKNLALENDAEGKKVNKNVNENQVVMRSNLIEIEDFQIWGMSIENATLSEKIFKFELEIKEKEIELTEYRVKSKA